METQLDSLYSTEYKRLNYKEMDKLVRKYQRVTDERSKSIYRAELLHAFHHYFMKYVSLLKGTIGNITSNDTMSFLSLFLAGNKTPHDYIGVYKYLVYLSKKLEDTDIYNELVAMFITLLDKFEFQPKVSFSRYITQYMRWDIKKWLMSMANDPLIKTNIPCEPLCLTDANTDVCPTIEMELPVMNLGWVHRPFGSKLFSVLTVYERYLLYLSYKEGFSIRQISECLGRTSNTIHTHLKQAMQKLQEQYSKGE